MTRRDLSSQPAAHGTAAGPLLSTHRHSGIGLYTPASVHDGTAITIRACRQQVLDDAFAASPHRFHGRRPQAPTLPAKVWINQPRAIIETQEAPQTNQAA